MTTFTVPADYYRQYDADYTLEVPGEGYLGWTTEPVELSLEHTAVVVMHAWDAGTREEFPGWYRRVEYIPRATEIARTVFPPLLSAVRDAGMTLFHVVGGGDYYTSCPGYLRAAELAGPPPPPPPGVERDPVRVELDRFRHERAGAGLHNEQDITRGFARVDFSPEARPLDHEGVAEDGRQLFALCREAGINHLIYAGFAINWCLLLSPGGMVEMQRHGLLCSAFRQAVTAVENKETARGEWGKENALWRVSVAFGLVFNVDDFIRALPRR